MCVATGERSTNATFEEKHKFEEASFLRQLLGDMKKEIRASCKRAQDLEVVLIAAEEKVEEAKLGTSFSTKQFDAWFDTDLKNDLERKKEHIEDMRQDLINYKLCLY